MARLLPRRRRRPTVAALPASRRRRPPSGEQLERPEICSNFSRNYCSHSKHKDQKTIANFNRTRIRIHGAAQSRVQPAAAARFAETKKSSTRPGCGSLSPIAGQLCSGAEPAERRPNTFFAHSIVVGHCRRLQHQQDTSRQQNSQSTIRAS